MANIGGLPNQHNIRRTSFIDGGMGLQGKIIHLKIAMARLCSLYRCDPGYTCSMLYSNTSAQQWASQCQRICVTG